MNAWQLYLFLKLDNMVKFTEVTLFACILILFIGGLFLFLFSLDEEPPKVFAPLKKIVRYSIIALIILTAANIFIPTTKQMATIYVLPKIIDSVNQNEDLKEIPGDLIKLTKEWMAEKMKGE
jgi:hypothetical protein